MGKGASKPHSPTFEELQAEVEKMNAYAQKEIAYHSNYQSTVESTVVQIPPRNPKDNPFIKSFFDMYQKSDLSVIKQAAILNRAAYATDGLLDHALYEEDKLSKTGFIEHAIAGGSAAHEVYAAKRDLYLEKLSNMFNDASLDVKVPIVAAAVALLPATLLAGVAGVGVNLVADAGAIAIGSIEGVADKLRSTRQPQSASSTAANTVKRPNG